MERTSVRAFFLILLVFIHSQIPLFSLSKSSSDILPTVDHPGAIQQPATPNFTITVYPRSQTVYIGGKVNYDVGLTSQNGFSGQVTLSVQGLSPSLLLLNRLDPDMIDLAADSVANSTLTIDAINAGEKDYDDFQVLAVSGSLNGTANISITIAAGGSQPTLVSYVFLAGVLLFATVIILYGLRTRRAPPSREEISDEPRPPPI